MTAGGVAHRIFGRKPISVPHGLGSIHESGLEQGGGSWTSMVGGRSLCRASLLDVLSLSHEHEWHSILCNLPNKLIAIYIPMPILFLRVFSLEDFLVFSAPPRVKDTVPSFHVTIIPPCRGAVLALLGGWIFGSLFVVVEMNAVDGRSCGGEKGGFLMGHGWVLLSPDLIPYSLRGVHALQHVMYCKYLSFLSCGILLPGTCVLLNLHPST
jgi:hypothetical protein